MWKFKSMTLLAVLGLTFTLSNCASKKKASASDASSMSHDMGNSASDSLMINGGSDLGTAGPLKTVHFAFDSSTLSENTRLTLEANAEFLKTNPSVQIDIEGHSDERGGAQYNLDLGLRRSNSVKDYLISLGVPSGSLSTSTKGKDVPLIQGHDETSWQKNRRANFVILSK